MPRIWPAYSRLLGYPRRDWRREQDERLRLALDEARAKAELGYQAGNFPLKTKEK